MASVRHEPARLQRGALFVDLTSTFGYQLFLKCEGFNFAGSVELKAALAMVNAAERAGRLRPGSVLVESSSGNLGVALSMIAANRGYGFVCVTDTRCNLATRRMMEALGARVHTILNLIRTAASSARASTMCGPCAPPTRGTCG